MQHHPLSQLDELVREIRHIENERAREGDEGRWRRRQGARLAELLDRFELLVERWVPDADAREQWRQAVHHGGESPEVLLPRMPPPLYVGRSADGVRLEIREDDDGTLLVRIGDDVVLRDPTELSVSTEPFEINGRAYPEVPESPADALDALRSWVATARIGPPWEWAGLLFADGLVDQHLALTARGERVLELTGGIERPPEPLPERWRQP